MTESEKPPPRLKKRSLSPKQRRAAHISRGEQFEHQAARFLTTAGYQILDHNIRWKTHELDIIALDPTNQDLVFVEVKGLSKGHSEEAAAAVNWRKLNSLQTAAYHYRHQRQLQNKPYRFDIITVTSGTIAHYKNVTWLY